jgi:hypothetical protein
VATGYSYPVVPASSVPAAQHKLGHSRFLMWAGGAFAVLVVLISAVAVSQKPTTALCHFSCGPDVGPRLLSSTAYQNSQYGFRVEYESPPFSIAAQDQSGVELLGNQDNFIVFKATTGGDVTSAIQDVVSNLNTNEFQDLQEISSVVPGAEIGFVPGSGEAFSANFVAPGAGTSQTVTVMVMAATQGNLTITVVVVGVQDLSTVANLPFGLKFGSLFDFEVSNTIWPGGA